METILKNEALGPFLDDEAVLKIVRQHTNGTLSLAAFDCNWIGKSGIKGEKNYFNVWASVSFHEKKDKVFLHGGRFCNWNLEYEMNLVGTAENIGVYRLSLNDPDDFPNEFVIRLDRETGEQIYDNNNYRNFFIDHGKGHFASALAQSDTVFSFETIISVKVINC